MTEERTSRGPLDRRALTRRAVLGATAVGLGAIAVAIGREEATDPHAATAAPTPEKPAAQHGGHSGPPPSQAHAGGPGVTVIDQDTRVDHLHVPAGSTVVFAPDRPVTLTCRGNAVVEGVLELAPKDPSVTHRVVFEGVDEQRFVGDGMEVLPHDIGLWVMGDGELRLAGHPRTAWVRAAGAVKAGQMVLELASEPSGWMPGDELVITATAPPTVDDHADAVDVLVVAEV
ncbi:MAG TPA: hypothetical protein VFX41_04615, partial [Actinomycetales bacterium]|nr:hypothetical protein [Actinomycetales bacterium]